MTILQDECKPTRDAARRLAEAVEKQREAKPDCTHPTDQIMDRPDKSYCRKCGQDVPPLMRETIDASAPDPNAEAWRRPSGRVPLVSDGTNWHRKSVFPVFPSGE